MKKILIIEDDKIMRENTAEILELAQFVVLTAPNGKLGSVMAREQKPDLIICDIMMPELDGYGVLHILSKDPKTASIPFIFLSAKAERSEIRKGMELGADDYLTKPFEDTDLLNAIEVRLKKSEILRKEYSRDLNGLNNFFEQVGEILDLRQMTLAKATSNYKKKEGVYHLGDNPHYLFFILKGSVKTFKTHDDGKEFITKIYKTGDFFGHVPLFEQSNYFDSAITQEETEICKIPRDEFLNLIYMNRDVSAQFIRLLSNHVEEQEKTMLGLAYDTVRKRTAEALILLAKQTGQSGPKATVRVTREDLASMAGTATETVIRSLAELKADKLIEVNGREITIPDLENLSKIP